MASFDRKPEISPRKGQLYAVPVKFDDLWKIAAPVGFVEGFDLTAFDRLCQKARSAVDAIVEPQPLWEYPCIITGEQVVVAQFDFNSPPSPATFSTKITPQITGTNGIVFWMDWVHDGYTITSGLLENCTVGNRPQWSVGHRQGVYFLPEQERSKSRCSSVIVNVNFCSDGQLLFHFQHEN
ncbi:unnamed protein product [Gongylonema pulchrum]|uniref:Uncharacterized protein n=1 Tax=Gongylonema pulchrum TaxID=637853 RepID=A0A3P7R9A5_9BILA|nr:unnamed protein product [Gongylonema pulchrum]